MKNLIIILMAILSLNSSGKNTNRKMSESVSIPNVNHMVTVVNFDKLQSVVKKHDNKLYVVNFWATWCRPCVMELPEFMEVNKIYRNNPDFKMILVSMDIAVEADSNVQKFLIRNKIDADVYLLDDNKRMNQWIPAVDKNWGGSIPATVFYRNGEKLDFKESKIQKSELVKIISKYL